jgi:hypothetical protein
VIPAHPLLVRIEDVKTAPFSIVATFEKVRPHIPEPFFDGTFEWDFLVTFRMFKV